MELAITKEDLVKELTKQLKGDVEYLDILHKEGDLDSTSYHWAIGRRGAVKEILMKVCGLSEADFYQLETNIRNELKKVGE